MTGLWLENEVPIVGKVGTPLLFDVGVYLTVAGVTLRIILNMAEAEEG
jgi:multicomponent Na+:H+ antiporter subunit B